VAIKVLADKFRAIPNVLRFQRQAEVEASLNHPHIVTIYTLNKLPD
jgi:serine/threonine protein kinase